RFAATLAITLNKVGCNVNLITGAWTAQLRGKRNDDAIMLLELLARLKYSEASMPIDPACYLNHSAGFIASLITCSAVSEALNALASARNARLSAHGCIVVHFCACGANGCSPIRTEIHGIRYLPVRSSKELLHALEASVNSMLLAHGVHNHA
ncbi:MAG: hypothetical protein RMK18_05330, partial [Armatimonadota bacterium]|nr:hypothetical protein [Armatimonadota bacterium]MDW8025274.1 hypothetical protein [Armatimonadota bacterium]